MSGHRRVPSLRQMLERAADAAPSDDGIGARRVVPFDTRTIDLTVSDRELLIALALEFGRKGAGFNIVERIKRAARRADG